MTTMIVINGAGDTKYIKGTGDGSSGDPFISEHLIADGNLVTLGAKADAKSTATDTTAITAMQVLKQISYMLQNPIMPVSGGKSVALQLTVTNGAYAALDVAGGLLTFANAVSGNGKHSFINSVKLTGVVANEYDLHFYNADIATPRADNAVYGIAAADGAIYLGYIPIRSTDYVDAQTSFKQATVRGGGLQVKAGAATTSIYAYLVAKQTTSPGTTRLDLVVDFEYID